MGDPVVLIPVNALDRAKGRLADVLEPVDRVMLAAATFAEVVNAAGEAGLRTVILAARPEDVIFEAEVMEERGDVSGLTAQLEGALESLGAPEVLILHADLPLATGAELRRLVEAAPPAPSVTLVRSRDGGTNAMLMRPSGCIPLRYGPGSFEKHVSAAREVGVEVCVVESEALSLDLDTSDDIEVFLRDPRAPETAAYGIARRRLAERP
jgi:2-phospho-L-lactate guanylyltransferase